MRKRYRVILCVVALATSGCQGLLIHEGDSRGVKTAKVAGRVAQGFGTGWLSEAYYAGQRSRR